MNEKPTDNLPGVTEKMPVAPAEFEVADIKPSDPDAKNSNMRIQVNGRFTSQGMAVQTLLLRAKIQVSGNTRSSLIHSIKTDNCTGP